MSDLNILLVSDNVEKTFKQRKTLLEAKIPVALTPVFTNDKQKGVQWSAFQRRLGDIPVPDLEEIRARLNEFLGPVLLNNRQRIWQRSGPWL